MDVKLCENCKGEGWIDVSISPREKKTVMCTKCKGKGRILTQTYTIEVPFGSDMFEVNKTCHEIILLIRDLNNKLNETRNNS